MCSFIFSGKSEGIGGWERDSGREEGLVPPWVVIGAVFIVMKGV